MSGHVTSFPPLFKISGLFEVKEKEWLRKWCWDGYGIDALCQRQKRDPTFFEPNYIRTSSILEVKMKKYRWKKGNEEGWCRVNREYGHQTRGKKVQGKWYEEERSMYRWREQRSIGRKGKRRNEERLK
uniref:Uncharacterized protein n=1 Tax=Onchocerca volvulus TaxID=6282 RepID=A0A8R1XV62_ONCVO